MSLAKNVLQNEYLQKKYQMIHMVFHIDNWHRKSDFVTFWILQSWWINQCNFCDLDLILKCFHQIIFTWWNIHPSSKWAGALGLSGLWAKLESIGAICMWRLNLLAPVDAAATAVRQIVFIMAKSVQKMLEFYRERFGILIRY